MSKVFGFVTIYEPLDSYLENIKTYVNFVEKLYVIDNSDNVNQYFVKCIKEYKNVVYIRMEENRGIAYPLNFILDKLENEKWLLTMDQDSFFSMNDIKQYIKDIEMIDEDKVYAITLNIIPKIDYMKNKKRKEKKEKFFKTKSCYTSGCLVNIQLAKRIGGFDENLFVDFVDTEYCFRGNYLKLDLLVNTDVDLIHQMGILNRKFIKRLWVFKNVIKKMGILDNIARNHNELRWYYRVRNTLYIAKKYPFKSGHMCWWLIKYFFKVLLSEENKYKKFKFMIIGIYDFYNDKLGKYQKSF